MTYLFRLFSFGLIAYVTNITDHPNQIKLLLVDARHPPVATDGCPITKHEPLLIYAPNAGSCNDWCRLEMGVCRCPLERVRVLFDFDPLPTQGASVDHDDMEYVPSLRQLRMKAWVRQVKPECIYKKNKIRVCPFVTAEAEITPREIHTCEMAGGMDRINKNGLHEHYSPPKRDDTYQLGRPFAFRSASQGEFEMLRNQYVAIKQVMVSDVLSGGVKSDSAGEYVEVSVVSYDNTEEPSKIRIYAIKCPTSTAKNPQRCFDLAIANVPFHANQHLLYGRCQGHGIDRDFELFEDLTKTQQDMGNREVPFDRGMALKTDMHRDELCDSALLENFNRWLRTDQATSECSGGKIRN